MELQVALQNDQFAAHPPISPVLHISAHDWLDWGDDTATVTKERNPPFPYINTINTITLCSLTPLSEHKE